MNKKSRCRLCLSEYNVNVAIFGHDNSDENRDVLAKIRQFTAIEISADDSLPKYICNSCLKLLELFHQFSVTAANSEIKLLQAISSAASAPKSSPPLAAARVFSSAETRPKETNAESIHLAAACAAPPPQRKRADSDEDGSHESIFFSFRNCCSLDDVCTAASHTNRATQKNSPNVPLPQLRPAEAAPAPAPAPPPMDSKSERELRCEDIEHVPETPGTRASRSDIAGPSTAFIQVPGELDAPAGPEPSTGCPARFDSDTGSQDLRTINSDVFHHGTAAYIPDLDGDVQVTLLDEHHLPLSLVTKRHAPLRWLLDVYCQLSGNAPNQIGFRYKGHLIKESSTACNLGLRYGDVLHVVLLWRQQEVRVGPSVEEYYDEEL